MNRRGFLARVGAAIAAGLAVPKLLQADENPEQFIPLRIERGAGKAAINYALDREALFREFHRQRWLRGQR